MIYFSFTNIYSDLCMFSNKYFRFFMQKKQLVGYLWKVETTVHGIWFLHIFFWKDSIIEFRFLRCHGQNGDMEMMNQRLSDWSIEAGNGQNGAESNLKGKIRYINYMSVPRILIKCFTLKLSALS